jgi:3-oxoacyl-[acyl-carrier-protein] synthase II
LAAKSFIGNLGAGGGTTELAASLLALRYGLVPETLNYDEPDQACPILVHRGKPRPVTRPHAVKIAFTQMGQCAAIVVRKAESGC